MNILKNLIDNFNNYNINTKDIIKYYFCACIEDTYPLIQSKVLFYEHTFIVTGSVLKDYNKGFVIKDKHFRAYVDDKDIIQTKTVITENNNLSITLTTHKTTCIPTLMKRCLNEDRIKIGIKRCKK